MCAPAIDGELSRFTTPSTAVPHAKQGDPAAQSADPRPKNKNGSTALHLAVQNTGKSNSGSSESKSEQARVIALLLQRGATPTDVDANGKSVADAASSDWIRELLHTS